MARGFEYLPELGPCHAITAIEIMEHLEDPLRFIREALTQTQTSTFIFTTKLFVGFPPTPERWWYYSFETGQHISFFQRRTLEVLAEKLGLSFASRGGVHVFSQHAINEMSLGLFTGRISSLLSWWVRKTLGTKVMSDHLKIVDRLNDSR